jgi:sulfite reductase (NADPH) flavoprotein alpha-component
MSKRPIKAALLQVHSIIGLAISLVLTVIGLTGATMSFEDEIGDWLNAAIMHVEVRPAPTLSPDELVARLQAGGHAKVSAVIMASDPAAAVYVRFARQDGERPAPVYVDPYDARVLGPVRAEQFFTTVRQLHRWLLLPGDGKGWGRQITGVVAIGLIVMLISGLVLRWPRHVRSVRAWLKLNWSMRGRAFQWSLHSVAGTWVMLVYLLIAITGLWWSFDWYRDGATWLFSSRTVAAAPMAAKQPRAPRATAAESGPLTFDRAWQVFLQEQGSRYATAQLTLPNGGGTVMRIRSVPHGATREGQRDELRIDAATGRVVSVEIYADRALGDKVLASVLDIHRGAILGWPGKLLFMIAAALMPLFMVTGLLLYLSRRRLRAQSKPSRNHQRAAGMVAGE